MDTVAVNIEIITDVTRFYNLRNKWNDLLETTTSTPLPLTHKWLTTWWKNFAGDRELHISCIYEKNKLLAIAPLMKANITYRGIPTTIISLMANGHSPYCDVIFNGTINTEKISKILELLIRTNSENILVLAKVPKNSPTYSHLTTSSRAYGYRYGITKSLITPTIKLNNNWDDFYKSRSHKFRKSMKNKINRFAKEKDFSINREVITSRDHKTLKQIVEISKRSWKTNIKNDLGSNVAGREFLFGLVDAFGDTQAIQVWIVRKSDKPVAYEIHLISDGVVYPLRADYDESFKQYSPGSILEYTVLKTLFDEKTASVYDSCADDYWYLNNWTKEFRRLYNIEVFSNNFKSLLLYYLEFGVIPLLRVMRDKLKINSN